MWKISTQTILTDREKMNTIDLTKTPIQNMIALVNKSSNVEFTEAHLSFSAPTYKPSTASDRTNTIVTISANPSSPVQGTHNAKYKRLHLTDDFKNFQNTFSFPTGYTVGNMVNHLRNLLGLHPSSNLSGSILNDNKFKLTVDQNDYLYSGDRTILFSYV